MFWVYIHLTELYCWACRILDVVGRIKDLILCFTMRGLSEKALEKGGA